MAKVAAGVLSLFVKRSRLAIADELRKIGIY